MNSKISASEFFAKKNQLFKLIKIVNGTGKTGHRSANLNVITECNECGEQREGRGNSTNFLKCLRCRTDYDLETDARIKPEDLPKSTNKEIEKREKELKLRDKNVQIPPKKLIEAVDLSSDDEPVEQVKTGKPKRTTKRTLPVFTDTESDEEMTPVKTTTTTTTKRATKKTVPPPAYDSDGEEAIVPPKPKMSLKDFAKTSLESIVCRAGEKTLQELGVKKKDRARALLKPDDDGDANIDESDSAEDFSMKPMIKGTKHRAVDVSKSAGIAEETDVPVVREEVLKVVRLKKGQIFMHEGIMFIAE